MQTEGVININKDHIQNDDSVKETYYDKAGKKTKNRADAFAIEIKYANNPNSIYKVLITKAGNLVRPDYHRKTEDSVVFRSVNKDTFELYTRFLNKKVESFMTSAQRSISW